MKPYSRWAIALGCVLIVAGGLLVISGKVARIRGYSCALMGIVAITWAYAPPGKPVRFSMGNLLVFVTIIALLLGTIVAAVNSGFFQQFQHGP